MSTVYQIIITFPFNVSITFFVKRKKCVDMLLVKSLGKEV